MVRNKLLLEIVWGMVMLAGIVAALGAPQKNTPQKTADKYRLADEEVKELILLMDTDENGKISKPEYMKFMETEFDRLDVDKNGQLDVNELKRSRLRPSRGAVGK